VAVMIPKLVRFPRRTSAGSCRAAHGTCVSRLLQRLGRFQALPDPDYVFL
jgi:hypothetical protein